MIGAGSATFLIPNMPVFWIGGFLWGGSLIFNGFRQWLKVREIDGENTTEVKVVEELVACPKCGTDNRVRSHAAKMRPVCGKCRSHLPERSGPSMSFPSFLLFAQAHQMAIIGCAVVVVLVGSILWGSCREHHPSPSVATQSTPPVTHESETTPTSVASPRPKVPIAVQDDESSYIQKHKTEIVVYTPPPAPPPLFAEPELPLPRHGVYEIYDTYDSTRARCPLDIKTRADGSFYFIKLEGWFSRQTVALYFVHAGVILDTHVPPGSYRLKYANGQHWYGVKHLFGPDTTVSMADMKLDFTQDAKGYTGHTIELILQMYGNLSTKRLRKEDF